MRWSSGTPSRQLSGDAISDGGVNAHGTAPGVRYAGQGGRLVRGLLPGVVRGDTGGGAGRDSQCRGGVELLRGQGVLLPGFFGFWVPVPSGF
ncbi:hypothetical protein [Tessaracoccus sp. Z1128]